MKLMLWLYLIVYAVQPSSADLWDWVNEQVDKIPVFSQLKSAGQALAGDTDGAKKTQENFVDKAIGFSQLKSAVQSASGDNKGAEETQKKFLDDKIRIITALFDGGSNEREISGEIVSSDINSREDTSEKKKVSSDNFSDFTYEDMIDSSDSNSYEETSKERMQPATREIIFFDTNILTEPGLKPGVIDTSLIGDSHFANLYEYLDKARLKVGLSCHHAQRLTLDDFRVINDIEDNTECTFCTVAAFKRTTVKSLMTTYEIQQKQKRNIDPIAYVVKQFKRIGYDGTELKSFTVDEFVSPRISLRNHVYEILSPGQSTSFALGYITDDNYVDVVLMRAWKLENYLVQFLITDFRQPVKPTRFSVVVPEGKEFHVITPKVMNGRKNNLLKMYDPVAVSAREGCNKRVIGYLTNWSKRPFSVQQASYLTNVIFAFIKLHADGSLTMPTNTIAMIRYSEIIAARKSLAAKNVMLKVSFAIGGWENSQYFSKLLGDSMQRSNLIANIDAMIVDYNFDGIDVDWEYPITGGATEGNNMDKSNYVLFLKELRARLGTKLISIAAAAGEEAMRGFDVKNIIQYVDWIGVMSYDLNGAWDSKWGAYVGPNAALYHGSPIGYSGKLNVNWAVKQYVCKSHDSSKIIMGLPFYGRFWSETIDGKHPETHPIFRMAKQVNGKYGGDQSYYDLKNSWLKSTSGFSQHWDDQTKTPWAIENSTGKFLTYDDPRSIVEKVNYAHSYGLGGVMIWSVDQDDDKLSLIKSALSICTSFSPIMTYKCNPLSEVRWWTAAENEKNAGMCGKGSPIYNGYYPVCDPDDPGFSCCSKFGYCGSGPQFCDCIGCVNYAKNPHLLIAQPIKPSRQVQWHVGFDVVQSGAVRCGLSAPPVNNYIAICNPDDDEGYCCSNSGYCGSGDQFCDCIGCKNYRKLSETESLKIATKAEDVKWHIGFDVAKPGKPRCGILAPKINGMTAICNPLDDGAFCCSRWGFCGIGSEFCECNGCQNSRDL